jgi:type II secretory pathway pseudopilin PulG
MIGIIDAIAIPGLLRARMSANEAEAIVAMRSITSAQLSYLSKCGAYAPSLPALAADDLLPAEMTAANQVTKSGYEFTIKAAQGSEVVTDVAPGCDGGVSNYSALAVPQSPGSTGNRYFTTDERSTIFQDTSPAFSNPRPVDGVLTESVEAVRN